MAVIEKMESLLRAARFFQKIYLQYMLNFNGVYCIIKCTYQMNTTIKYGAVAEQEYAADLKSAAREGLGVRLPSAPPEVR